MTRQTLDLADPHDRLRALVKARGDLTGAIATWWLTGTMHLVAGSEIALLCGFESASVLRLAPRSDQNFDLTLTELPFYVDSNDGSTPERVTNPITGAECEPRREPSRMPRVPLTTNGITAPEGSPIPLTIRARTFPAEVAGGEVYLKDESHATVEGAGEGGFFVQEQMIFSAGLDDLQDPDTTSVAARIHVQMMMSPMDWLGMSADDAIVVGQMTGHKLGSVRDLPASFVERARQFAPAFLDDPESLLER
jgi:hypothetical protein